MTQSRRRDLPRRVRATARNVAEVVRFGGLDTGDEPSPFTVESAHPNYRLRHYFADDVPTDAPPIVLVPPLMITAEVWDVSPEVSGVAALHAGGLDVWVVDFGRPDRDPGGLRRDLADHVLAVDEAIDTVRERTGRDVVLAGYSQGGMFVYQTAALRRGKGIDSLITFGAPVDSSAPLPVPMSPDAAARLAGSLIDSGVFSRVAMPGWTSRFIFKMLTPAKSVQDRVRFLLSLHDRDALLPRERTRRFLDDEGWTAWSGPALVQFLENYFRDNRMLEGGLVVDDRLVTLADLDLPILTVVGSVDTIGHPDSVRAIRRAAPGAEVYELSVRAGHFGLVVGTAAAAHSWPAVVGWTRWRQGTGALPPDIAPAADIAPRPATPSGTALSALTQATGLAVGATRLAVSAAVRASALARSVASEAPAQLPRLQRIERLDPGTRISLGLLLHEQCRRDADQVCFLFGDHAYRQREVRDRVDAVLSGLIDLGVRPGERVGVLMHTRPIAFALVVALSRLGATAVLLRPDGDVAREVRLGRVVRLITDPTHAGVNVAVPVAVLGGRDGIAGDLPAGVVDLNRVDPDRVARPDWFVADPQRARDIAFVVFTGEGAGTRAVQITNHRWALSALGTASAASLRPGDTVYSTTPLYHSSTILMSLGGAVASGARFAMSTGDDADTFWSEVRRYGATHVSYTWSSLRSVVDAPPHRLEQHHPIRMFIGSGMPRNLWHRAAERFPTTRVLEFYASADGEAILANVSGHKVGSLGRPLPGTAEVRVAGFDQGARRLEQTSDGFARECLTDEVGLLLSRSAGTDGEDVLRNVFMAGDAWRSTGDLFLRDAAGEHWLAGPVAEIVDTADGPVLPAGTRYCLADLPGADLIVAYGVRDGDADALVAALTTRAGFTVDAAALDTVLDRLPIRSRPSAVQVMRSIPLTTWHRPVWRLLQRRGVPTPARGRQVWRRDEFGRYQLLG